MNKRPQLQHNIMIVPLTACCLHRRLSPRLAESNGSLLSPHLMWIAFKHVGSEHQPSNSEDAPGQSTVPQHATIYKSKYINDNINCIIVIAESLRSNADHDTD